MNKIKTLKTDFNNYGDETQSIIDGLNCSIENAGTNTMLIYNLKEAKIHIEWLHQIITEALD